MARFYKGVQVRFIGNLQITIYDYLDYIEKLRNKTFKAGGFVDNDKILKIFYEDTKSKQWLLYDVFKTLIKVKYNDKRYSDDHISEIADICAAYAIKQPKEKYTRPYFSKIIDSRRINYIRDNRKMWVCGYSDELEDEDKAHDYH